MKHWLMKSEPDVYSVHDLKAEKRSGWDGVRNYQARNLMRDEMQVGDPVLFYHSNTKPPGVAGLARVSRTGLADPTQFEPDSKYFDPKSSPDAPRWIMVEVEFVEVFPHFVSLPELRESPELDGLMVIKRGARLSVQPVSQAHFQTICKMAQSKCRVQ